LLITGRKGKFLSKDPARLADLELAFHKVRRVHCLAVFYNNKEVAQPTAPVDGHVCPACGAALIRVGGLNPIDALERIGCRDLGEARRLAGRAKVFGKCGGSG
jgi:hypothetical protein